MRKPYDESTVTEVTDFFKENVFKH